MVQRYRKGANAERELMRILFEKGFSILRAAGSGVNPLDCPDVIAIKKGLILAFECKAWDSTSLSISKEQFEGDVNWCEKAGARFIVGWKIPREGWWCLKPSDFRFLGKNYVTTKTEAQKQGLLLEDFLATL